MGQSKAKTKPETSRCRHHLPRLPSMDTFFLSHGPPTICIDETIPARSFFQSWLPAGMAGTQTPRAILIVSGHWETDIPAVNVVHGTNDTIYDYDGLGEFPEAMYQVKYLAKKTKELLEQAGFGPVKEEHGRGLDHGAWLPLMFMYPEADIPVWQLSVQTSRDGTYHYNLGKALAPLRAEGVLILGSGSATHNISKMEISHDKSAPVPQWAAHFDAWLTDSLLDGRYDDVNHYDEKAPCSKMAHPTPEHFYPLHVALGAAGDDSKAELIHSSWTHANHSYSSYRFTAKN